MVPQKQPPFFGAFEGLELGLDETLQDNHRKTLLGTFAGFLGCLSRKL
jgi:hypothetical protein